jgi:hypothetical protein
MKNKIILLALAFIPAIVFAQTDTTKLSNPKYVSAMEKQVATLDTSATPATLQKTYNSIERIANAEKKEWLPDYYLAYCLVMQAYQAEASEVDNYCDRATTFINRADSLKGDASEIYVMRAMIASARIKVDPRSRGAKYGKMSSAYLDTAETKNANNPRIYFVRASGLYYTPPMFGGGKNKAKPVLEDAIKKYDAWVPKNKIDPHWGRFRAQQMLDDCNKKKGD